MLGILSNLDRQLLLLINHLPHNYLTNNLFLFFSIAGYYGFIWFVLLMVLFIYDRLDNRKEVIALIIASLLNILIVEILLKNFFLRVRPETALGTDIVQILTPLSTYSFPSGHATIAFASAYIFSKQRQHFFWFFYLLAFFIAISRVYLGRHYPSDIIAGAILGYFIGIFSFSTGEKIFNKFIRKTRNKSGKKK